MNKCLKKFSRTIIQVCLLAVVLLGYSSCSETELTDSSAFKLHYMGMTDIGPSMEGNISVPTFIGGKPSDFEIVKVTLEGEEVENTLFSIDENTGSIRLNSVKETPIGLYRLSINCAVNGKRYYFKDIVSVNMMRAVPKEVKMTSDYIEFALDKIGEEKVPTTKVTTDNDHISINGYKLAGATFNGAPLEAAIVQKMFKIDQKGVISVIGKKTDFQPGIYKLSLRIVTSAVSGDDEEGIFQDAFTLNVISKPISLEYVPSEGKLEEETQESGKTSFISMAPTYVGSTEELSYSIAEIIPATDKITIDSKTGELKVEENHGLKAGENYKVSVKVTNKFSAEGVVFANKFTLHIVSFIQPVSNFSYKEAEVVEGTAFDILKNEGFKGQEVRYEFGELPNELNGLLSLDPIEGKLSAAKGNEIPVGTYTVKVKAIGPKNEIETTCLIKVVENINKFTFVDYGNNLGLENKDHKIVAQYRFHAPEEIKDVVILPTTDIRKTAEMKWKIVGSNNVSRPTIDEKTGAITLKENLLQNKGNNPYRIGHIIVKVTVGSGATSYETTVPVFFQMVRDLEGVRIEYTPFVLQVNPTKTFRSNTPKVTGVIDMNKLVIDFSRDAAFYPVTEKYDSNLFGKVYIKGEDKNKQNPTTKANSKPVEEPSTYLRYLWESICGVSNWGDRTPMSFLYKNAPKQDPSKQTLLYIDNSEGEKKFSIVVNSNIWATSNNEFINGVFMAQATFVTNGDITKVKQGKGFIPVAVWLNTKF